MTDARLPGRWLTDPRMDRLTDSEWRGFTRSLMFCAEHGTDGYLPPQAMRYVCPDSTTPEALAAGLRAQGLWKPHPDGGQDIPDWSTGMGQSTAAAVEALRAGNRERKARERERKRNRSEAVPVTRDITEDITRDDVGEARQGEDRTGEEQGAIAVPRKPYTGGPVAWDPSEPF